MAVLDRMKAKANAQVPSSSMADIAFLLLIFFLVTTTFPKDKGLAIVLPEAEQPVPINPRNILHIIVRADGLVDVKRGESPRVQSVSADDVEAIWRQDASQNANLVAALKTDPRAPYKFMVDVLDALHAAGAERISLQLFEG